MPRPAPRPMTSRTLWPSSRGALVQSDPWIDDHTSPTRLVGWLPGSVDGARTTTGLWTETSPGPALRLTTAVLPRPASGVGASLVLVVGVK